MGRRKERRIAAMIAAGRRVKLDIFAEPSGDSGGSSVQDELGGDKDPRHAGSPDSPSSSGKQLENPLLLLGQYSDDELDEESSKRLDHPTPENCTSDDDEQVNGSLGTGNEDMENNPSMDLNAQKDKPHGLETGAVSLDPAQNLEDSDSREIDSAVTRDLCKEVISVEETSVPGSSDVQPTDNVISSWKVVLHEESNQYYYWNTITGETSWVVPDGLVQGTELTGEQKPAPDTEARKSALSRAHKPSSSLDVELDGSITMHSIDHSKAGNVIYETQEIHEPGALVEQQNNEDKYNALEDKTGASDTNQTEATVATDALYDKTFSVRDRGSSQESGDALLGNGNATDGDSDKYKCNAVVHEEDDIDSELSSSALKHGEYLLDRLKSMKGSKSHIHRHDWISKYILEVEIRLSDIKSLLPFGSSLLPFWVHCERQLKELECTVDNEVSQIFKNSQICESESPPHKSRENEWNEIEADGNENKVVCLAFENSHASAVVTSFIDRKDSQNETANGSVLHAKHDDAIDYHIAHSSSCAVGNSGVHEAAQPDELTPEITVHAGEDVDMDVDMEVDDAIPTSATITRDSVTSECCAPEEQPIQPNPPAEYESFVPLEAFCVPLPPDDDWIPPPPPDNELVPPPPPDDPTEPSYPPLPTYFETVPSLSYAEQYNLSYPASSFEYYGQTNTEFPTTNVYGHTEGCQVAVPHPPVYYEALPTTYPGAAPIVVNPIEPLAYYDLRDGTVLPVPVASGVHSSVLSSESGHETLGSDPLRSAESHAEVNSTLSKNEVGISGVNGATENASIELPIGLATIQSQSTVSVVESAPVSSTPAVASVAVATKSTTSNVQNKVLRSKKRTVAAGSTLKSNKKVSSLVDKWKAAKEELHEDDEDEPENSYESLEKKRKREIEEWRAQQIASGEAKDNANFQPLGGDWYELSTIDEGDLNLKLMILCPKDFFSLWA
ncbi:hypothetical protein U1Q18_023946 [Sarracenia purpurea var. burkii]